LTGTLPGNVKSKRILNTGSGNVLCWLKAGDAGALCSDGQLYCTVPMCLHVKCCNSLQQSSFQCSAIYQFVGYCRCLCMWTKLDHTSIHMKHTTIINSLCVDQTRLNIFISCWYYFVKICRISVLFLIHAALFCDQIEPKSLTLGEVLDGDRMALSLYELQFGGLEKLSWHFEELVIMWSHAKICIFKQYALLK